MTNKRGQITILPQNDAQTSAESFDVSLFKIGSRVQDLIFSLFRCVHASLYEGLSVGPSVGPSVRWSVSYAFFLTAEFEWKQHINHRISIKFEL